MKLFCSLCSLGAELVALHLLESPKLAKPIARFPAKGSNQIEKGFPKYIAPGEAEPAFVAQGSPSSLAAIPRLKEGRVYINRTALTRPDKSRHPLPAGEGRGEGEGAGQYFEGIPPEVWNFHIGAIRFARSGSKTAVAAP